MKYRIKEVNSLYSCFFFVERSEDSKEWEIAPCLPSFKSLKDAKTYLDYMTKPKPEPIYHDYP